MSDSIGVMDELKDVDSDILESASPQPEEDFDLEELHEVDFDTLGIDPLEPTGAKPGSEAKVIMLAARYAAGLPLWHNSDCYDHGPGGAMTEELDEVF